MAPPFLTEPRNYRVQDKTDQEGKTQWNEQTLTKVQNDKATYYGQQVRPPWRTINISHDSSRGKFSRACMTLVSIKNDFAWGVVGAVSCAGGKNKKREFLFFRTEFPASFRNFRRPYATPSYCLSTSDFSFRHKDFHLPLLTPPFLAFFLFLLP